jgi:hypothetical protein
MRKLLLTCFAAFLCFEAFSQEAIEWTPEYEVTLEDFKSKGTKIDPSLSSYYLGAGIKMDFNYAMSNYEYMFTKNFNSKVTVVFQPTASTIKAPNLEMANNMVAMADFQFDLAELYARKFRKKIYDEKEAFSDPNKLGAFFESVNKDWNDRSTQSMEEADLGMNREVLDRMHKEVLLELEQYPDFCKECKPVKKKK